MIYGNVNNEFFNEQCALLPKPLSLALKYLKENDMARAKPGVFDLKLGESECILQVLDLKTVKGGNMGNFVSIAA